MRGWKMLALCLALSLAAPVAASAAQPRLDALGQDGPRPFPGAAAGRPRVVSPEIHADRRVTLRLYAPDAKEVRLTGQLIGPNGHFLSPERFVRMTRGADGVWSHTVGPLEPQIYEYGFTVDGFTVADPGNASGYVEIPGPTPAFYDAQPVPHGSVRMEVYESPTFGLPRWVWVYTPPGYDTSNQRYPVLYLTHGSNCCESAWVERGRANLILDNLIAAGRARPMILVMPLGARAGGSDGLGPNPVHREGATPPQQQSNYAFDTAFERDLVTRMVPWIDAKFRTLPDAANRGLGGLSQGGIQTFTIGLRHPETFRWLVPMSAGAENQGDDQFVNSLKGFYEDPAQVARLRRDLKLLYVTVGDQDVLHEASVRIADRLKAAGVPLTFRAYPGRHEMSVWRSTLHDVAPLLFR